MRGVLVLLVTCACNAALGLDETHGRPPADAQFFDAPADAPYACPPFGTAPVFSAFFHQIIPTGACGWYTNSPSSNLAVAACSTAGSGGPLGYGLEQGPIGATSLVPLGLTPSLTASNAVLSPEGDQLFVSAAVGDNGAIAVYTPTGVDAWAHASDVVTSPNPTLTVSTPTRVGVSRRVLYLDGTLHELEEGPPGKWTEINAGKHSNTALGVSGIASVPQLSPDGLRMVFRATGVLLGAPELVVYADRASLADPFNPAVALDGIPADAQTPFLAEDCSRLYFSGLGSVLYVTQR
jgi:hypothetical protein